MKSQFVPALVGLLLILATAFSRAESFHLVSVEDLDFAPDQEGLQEALKLDRFYHVVPNPGFRLPDSVDAYIADLPEPGDAANTNRSRSTTPGTLKVAVRFRGGDAVSGFIDLITDRSEPGLQAFAFTLDPAKLKAASKEQWEHARRLHYARLARSESPGKPLFRLRAGDEIEAAAANPRNRARRMESDLSETYAMFSGRRAIAENLALDRELILGRVGDAKDVPLSDITGIKVDAIDWKDRLPAEPVKVDALAHALPLDQHALFLPSVGQLFNLVDLIEKEGAPLVGMFDVRNPFRDLPTRYLAQLGLDDREALSKLPVKSIAVTGGDPFFTSGTDVAILLEVDNPEEVIKVLPKSATQIRAVIGNAVVCSNSSVQIERLKAVQSGESPSLGAADEFQFFRHRYPVGAGEESAFAFLSDATIRRWGSPKFRIAASRRARAMVALGDLTARQHSDQKLGDDYQALLGEASADPSGLVRSERFGTLNAITPISGLNFETVTANEQAAYENWRRGYESGWARVFDPIAIRLALDEDSRGLDLTVLPLTIDSEYRQWIDMAGNAKLSAMARDPHAEALLFASFAVDSTSESFRKYDTELISLFPALKIKPLSWVGQSVSVFFDDGFYWRAVEHAGNGPELDLGSIGLLPIGIRVESTSSIKLALFLGALKGLAETSAPDLLSLETRKHGERSYVAVIGNGDDIGTELTLYYAAQPTALLISLDEGILKRAIDRESGAAAVDIAALPEAEHSLLKSSPGFLGILGGMASGGDLRGARRIGSWRALPILNEWHRHQKDLEPEMFHRRFFGEDITCPGGKGYRWNAEAMTMESVAYGHPAAPLDGGESLLLLEKFNSFTAGLGFEDDGLRLWAKLEKTAPEEAVKPAVEAAGGVQLATAEELTPTRPGGVFKYEWQGPDGKQSHTIEVLKSDKAGEHRVRRSWFGEGDETTASEDREVIDGGLKLLGRNWNPGKVHYSKPLLILPEILFQQRDSVAEYEFDLDESGKIFNTIGQVTIRPVGLEDVEVPAGKFTDCVRVEETEMTSSDGEVSRSTTTSWYKKGIGLVKLESSGDRREAVRAELLEFHIPDN